MSVPINRENYFFLVGCFAPFLFKENGRLVIDGNMSRVYLRTLESMVSYANRGYLDFPLYVSEKTSMPLWKLDSWVREIKPLFGRFDMYKWWWWKYDDEAKQKGASYIKALHQLTDSTFSQSHYNEAWENFKAITNELAKEMV